MTTVQRDVTDKMKEIKVRLWGTDIVAGISRCTAIVSASFMPLKVCAPPLLLTTSDLSCEKKDNVDENGSGYDATGSSSAASAKRKRKGVVTKQAKESLDSVYETLAAKHNFNSETGEGERPTVSSLSLPPFSLHPTFPSMSPCTNNLAESTVLSDLSQVSEVMPPTPHLTLAQRKKNDTAFNDAVHKFWKMIEDDNYFQPFSKKVHRMDDLNLKGGNYDEFRDTFSTPFCVTNTSYFNDIPEPVSDDADSMNLGLVSDKMPILNPKKASNGFDTTSYKDIRQETQLKNGMAGTTSNGSDSTLDDSEDGDFYHDFLYKRIVASYVLPTGEGKQSGNNWRYSDSGFRYGDRDGLKDESPHSSSALLSSDRMPSPPSSSSKSYLTSSHKEIHPKQTATIPLLTPDNNVNYDNTNNMTIICKTGSTISADNLEFDGKLSSKVKLKMGSKSNFNDNNVNTSLTVSCTKLKQNNNNNNMPLHLSKCNPGIYQVEELHSDPIENICSCLGDETGGQNEKIECLCSCNSNSEFSVESVMTTSSSSSTSTATPLQSDCTDTLPLSRSLNTILELAEIGLINSYDFHEDKRNGKIFKKAEILYTDMTSIDSCDRNSTFLNIGDNLIKQPLEETDIETETEMEVIIENTVPIQTIHFSHLSNKFEFNRQDDDINLSIRYLVEDLKSEENRLNERIAILRKLLAHPKVTQECVIKRETSELNRSLINRWQKLRKKMKSAVRNNKSNQK